MRHTLCESSHEDVDAARVDVEVVAYSSSARTKSTDGVSLINEQEELGTKLSQNRSQRVLLDHDSLCTAP